LIPLATEIGPLALALLAQEGRGSFWMPPQASTFAPDVDGLFYFIFWVSAFFFVLILSLMIVFVVRYRRRAGVDPQPSPSHNTALEITWTAIPVVVVVAIFSVGFRSFMRMAVAPGNVYEIQVAGQRWKWLFTYPNGYVDENLHVPANRPVRLVLRSEDVIHSLFIPAFRLKKDVVPGRDNKAWFQATRPGEYPLSCAEYCGTGHSDMRAKVVVHEPGQFEKWLESASNFLERMSPSEAGQLLYLKRGCSQCHSVDGSGGTGPSFKGLFGRQQPLAGGSWVTVEESYIRESILDPQAKVAVGFQPVMPTYQGRLKDQEITALIEYIKTLKE